MSMENLEPAEDEDRYESLEDLWDDMTGTEEDLAESLEVLVEGPINVEFCQDGRIGVWDEGSDELIGSGASLSEALEDAVRTVSGWA